VLEGCTPGFWQGGLGSTLWNSANDPDWVARGGEGTNPFVHTTPFTPFFTNAPGIGNATMIKLVSGGGGSNPAVKAARDVVAAYLNVSYGLDLDGLSTQDIKDLWTAAVASGNFASLHNYLAALNQRFCPIH
jgi:hypothetical protein